jgi:hypothetical protein
MGYKSIAMTVLKANDGSKLFERIFLIIYSNLKSALLRLGVNSA